MYRTLIKSAGSNTICVVVSRAINRDKALVAERVKHKTEGHKTFRLLIDRGLRKNVNLKNVRTSTLTVRTDVTDDVFT